MTMMSLVLVLLLVLASLVSTRSKEVGRLSSHHCSAVGEKPSNWGHLYVDGGTEPIEFFTSEFGTLFPCEPLNLALAEPEDACTPLENGAAVKGKMVLVSRGTCTFTEKVENVFRAGGAMVIIANTLDNTLFSMPVSVEISAKEKEQVGWHLIPSVMVRSRSARMLKHQLSMMPETLVLAKGEFAEDEMGLQLVECGACDPGSTSYSEEVVEAIKRVPTQFRGGIAHIGTNPNSVEDAFRVDFFASFTGTSLPTRKAVPLVGVEEGNEFGCDPIAKSIPHGSVVLLKRGECMFSVKMEHVLKAGGWAVLLENSNAELLVPAVSPEELDSFNSLRFVEGTILTAAILFHRAGAVLHKKLEQGNNKLYIRFEPTEIDLGELKQLKGMEDLAYWSKHEEEAEQTDHHILVEHFISQLALQDELASQVRGTYME